MLSNYIPKRFAPALLKHVVAVSLFIPYIYCRNGNFFYQDFILANFFAILTMVCILTSWKLDLRENGILLAGMGILLIAYNACATYMNYRYHHWYGEQINTTISFLFFMVLLMVKDSHALFDSNTIKSIIHMIVFANVLAIIYRLITEQNRILIMNNYFRIDTYDEYMNKLFSWLYIFKCNYGFILVISIALCVVYKKLFRNTFTYILSLCVLFFALYLSNSYASIVAALLIFIGQFLDYIRKEKWSKKIVTTIIAIVPAYIGSTYLYNIISSGRNISTLGGRTPIWKTSLEKILSNPNGMLNFSIGADTYRYFSPTKGFHLYAYHPHNVFMIQMFRFSILVGGIFTLFMLMIFLFSIKRNLSFTTIFIIISFLILLCNDYVLTNIELSFFITALFLMFFRTTSSEHI